MSKTIGGVTALSGRIVFPEVGVWTCEAVLVHQGDTATLPFTVGSRQSIIIDSITLSGTVDVVVRSEPGRVSLHLHGGAGGMTDLPETASYQGATVAAIAASLLLQAGETLSTTSDALLLTQRPPTWQVVNDVPIGKQLAELLSRFSAAYRVLADGTIQLYTQPSSFPAMQLPATPVLLSAGTHGTLTYQVPALDTLPTPLQSLNGTTIREVEVSFTDRSTTLTLYPNTLRQYASDALKRFVEKIEFAATYPGVVQRQNTDGTFQFLPDDARIRGKGNARVPVRYGLPGASATVPVGTRCCVTYDALDPARCYVAGFDSSDGGSFVVTIGAASAAKFLAQSDPVDANFTAIKAFLEAVKATLQGGIGTASGGPGTFTVPLVASPPTPSPTACEHLKSA